MAAVDLYCTLCSDRFANHASLVCNTAFLFIIPPLSFPQNLAPFVGAVTYLWNTSICCFMSVRPSVSVEQLVLDGLSLNLILLIICRGNSSFVKIILYMMVNVLFCSLSRSVLLRMRNVSDKICRENRENVSCLITLFPCRSCRLWDNVFWYGRARQRTGGSMIRHTEDAICMQGNWGENNARARTYTVVLIVFRRQQWLRERATMQRLYVPHVSCFLFYFVLPLAFCFVQSDSSSLLQPLFSSVPFLRLCVTIYHSELSFHLYVCIYIL